MKTRESDRLLEQLKREVAAIQLMIEEVIHLNGMRQALSNAERSLASISRLQQKFYRDSNIPFTIENHHFLDETLTGKEYSTKISNITRDISSIKTSMNAMESQVRLRMKPFNDLVEHATGGESLNQKYVDALLSTAKALNPEGAIMDRIRTIGAIIKSVILLRIDEAKDIIQTQRVRNDLRSNVSGFFRRNFSGAAENMEPARINTHHFRQ